MFAEKKKKKINKYMKFKIVISISFYLRKNPR